MYRQNRELAIAPPRAIRGSLRAVFLRERQSPYPYFIFILDLSASHGSRRSAISYWKRSRGVVFEFGPREAGTISHRSPWRADR